MSQMVSDFFSHYFGKMRNEKKEIPTGTILRVCKINREVYGKGLNTQVFM